MKALRHTAWIGAAAALLVGAPELAADNANQHIQNLRGLQLQHAKIPVLNQDKLQMVIFAGSAERRGEMLIGFNTVLAIIRGGADADTIRDDWELVPYPLGSPLPRVLDFWKNRMYSEGIMNTPEAEIDNTGRRAGGNRDVHFRSPLLDLDGVGFEADFERRTISVNSQVRIVFRLESANPATLLKTPGKLPKKYEFVTASGDSMLIDSKRNEVMLVGNVRVVEEQAILTCDRLTIFWKNGGEQKKSSLQTVEKELHDTGVDRVLADGDVVISKRADTGEKIFADHLICYVTDGTAKLSGDREFPRIVSANGEVLSGRDIHVERDAKRMHITGGCRIEGSPDIGKEGKKTARWKLESDSGFFDGGKNFADFTGNVRMNDGSSTIRCDRMRVTAVDRGGKTAPAAPAADGEKSTGTLFGTPDIGTGGKDIKCADFKGHVEMIDGSKNQLNCDEAHADLFRREDGGIDLEKAQCFRNVRLKNAGADGTPPGVMTSDRGEFDNKANRVTLESNVRGQREKATLKCDRLDLHLGARKNAAAAAQPGSLSIGTGGDRIIRKAVASGNTSITDASGSLDCDKLTLYFVELPPGAKPEPGMFQSGGARLTDILAEGHVVGVNLASENSTAQAGLLSGKSSGPRKLYADRGRADLVRHLSHLSGSVKIRDDENQLDCDEMFLYGVRRLAEAPAPGAKTASAGKSAPEDPDADPFLLPGFSEDTVPAAINLTDDVRLKKILCLGNVRFERTDPDTKRKQEAGGSRCVYMTERRLITLTDTPPRRPWLRAEGRQQYGSRIVYDLNDNIFKSYDTDTFTIEPGN